MKIKKVAAICNKRKTVLMTTHKGTQWIGVPSALYTMDGMPELSEKNVLRVLDAPEKEREKYQVDNEITTPFSFEDNVSDEIEGILAPLQIEFCGDRFLPVHTENGTYLINQELLCPIDRMPSLQFALRYTTDHRPYFAVKSGLLLVAVVEPKTKDEYFKEHLQKVVNGIDIAEGK